jgi:hypothetical protein
VKLLHYQSNESLKEITKLCIKIAKKETCLLYVNSLDAANTLSDYFWKNPFFLPNGIAGDKFASIQPLLIADHYISRPVIINFEKVFIRHEQINCDTYILWNAKPYSADFLSYIQEGDTWKKQG